MSLAVTLTGNRARLDPLTADHARALVDAATEPGAAYRYTAVPADEDAAVAYVAAVLAEQARGEAVPYAITDLSRGRIVGSTRYLDLNCWTPKSPIPSVVEIGGTWLAPSVQRTGVNTEIKLLMLGHAFDLWGVHRVTLKTDARNNQSRRAIERLGATYEGTRRAHRPAADGTIRDTAYYSILNAEWPDVKEHLQRLLPRHHIQHSDQTTAREPCALLPTAPAATNNNNRKAST